MSGLIIFEPAMPTACERGQCEGKPKAEFHRDGTLWQCNHCGEVWEVWSGAQYNEPFSAWKISDSPAAAGFRGGFRMQATDREDGAPMKARAGATTRRLFMDRENHHHDEGCADFYSEYGTPEGGVCKVCGEQVTDRENGSAKR